MVKKTTGERHTRGTYFIVTCDLPTKATKEVENDLNMDPDLLRLLLFAQYFVIFLQYMGAR